MTADGGTKQGDHDAYDCVHIAGNHNRLFIGLRRFEIVQLAIQQLRGKEMLQASSEAPLKFFAIDA